MKRTELQKIIRTHAIDYVPEHADALVAAVQGTDIVAVGDMRRSVPECACPAVLAQLQDVDEMIWFMISFDREMWARGYRNFVTVED